MSYKPRLDVRRYGDDTGIYSWALFRADRSSPIVKGISKAHANHLKKLCLKMSDLPEKIKPIKNWFHFDYILDDEEAEKVNKED